jgi:hypothetical protein
LQLKRAGHVKISILKTSTVAKAVDQANAAIFFHFPDFCFMYSFHPTDGIGGVVK